MPNYDYQCKECSHNLEIFQNMSDEKLTECPECKKNSLERIINGGAALLFKGNGFYVNDSRPSTTKSEGK